MKKPKEFFVLLAFVVENDGREGGADEDHRPDNRKNPVRRGKVWFDESIGIPNAAGIRKNSSEDGNSDGDQGNENVVWSQSHYFLLTAFAFEHTYQGINTRKTNEAINNGLYHWYAV